MMSQCMVPNWNLSGHQRQEQIEGEDGNRSPHVHPGRTPDTTTPYLVPMNLPGLKFGSNHEVAELTWENGQVAMHGLGGLHPTPAPTKPTWGRSNGTLEAIVHQATRHGVTPPNESSTAASSGGQREERAGQVLVVPSVVKKRTRADPGRCMVKNFTNIVQEDYQRTDRSPCASDASATFGSKNDTTRITWSSYESPPSLKTKTMDEDSACHGGSQNRDEDAETKADTGRSHPTRRTRAAAVHNQSERRRRDRINQKMKTLQKLVPNASKTDKASMLDEVIEYLKQLQAQVQMMSSGTSMPRMMMMMPALGMQQHLQMSVQLARMGMLDINPMACAAAASHSLPPAAATAFVVPPAPPFMVPSMVARCPAGSGSQDASTGPLADPYWSFLAQSMNVDFFNKMAALYRQQVHQSTQATSNASQSSRVHGD